MFSHAQPTTEISAPLWDPHAERLDRLVTKLYAQLRRLDARFTAGELEKERYLDCYALPQRRLYAILTEQQRYEGLQAVLAWSQQAEPRWLS